MGGQRPLPDLHGFHSDRLPDLHGFHRDWLPDLHDFHRDWLPWLCLCRSSLRSSDRNRCILMKNKASADNGNAKEKIVIGAAHKDDMDQRVDKDKDQFLIAGLAVLASSL